MKITKLQEGVEYYGTFCGVKSSHRYKIENNELIFYNQVEHIWMYSNKTYNEIIDADFEPCEWEPRSGDKVYYPDFTAILYEGAYWDDSELFMAIKRNVGVYRTKEEAIVKAKKLGWT